MFVVFVLSAAAVLFAVVVVAMGRGDVLDTGDARPPAPMLPERRLSSADVDGVRFTVVGRGYRMDQVDEVVERLAAELDERDRVIAELEAAAINGPRNQPDDH